MGRKVLVVGSGGREHAIARAFSESPLVSKVYVAPGNPGMTLENNRHIECVPIEVIAIDKLARFVEENDISVTFVGPEQPLELGIVDLFNQQNLAIVGPTQVAAQLENSKWFAKKIMAEANVHTAKYQYFSSEDYPKAVNYCHQLGLPCVIKADGLMAGKGVVIPETMKEAETALQQMMVENHKSVLIEEFLIGKEFSHFSLVNGEHIISLGSACDYKRVLDFDKGANTGGMGAFAPVPWVDQKLDQQIIAEIVSPVAKEMVAQGSPFTGILYTGIILGASGPKVIEFNTRLGDPETQILLPLFETDFYDIIEAHLEKRPFEIQINKQTNLGIVLAAEGYPSLCKTNIPILVPDDLQEHVLFAGVGGEANNLYSTGGRILMMTSSAATLALARDQAYQQLEQLNIENTFYRQDIGLHRDLEEVLYDTKS